MTELFLEVLNRSISAGWLVLAVLAARLLLKKAPKWITVMLWGIVALRLVCPFRPESILSLIPSAETVPQSILTDNTPHITSGISAVNKAVNSVINQSFAPAPGDSANPLQIWIPVLAFLWLIGVAVMAVYTAVSYLRLRRNIKTAVLWKDNIFQSENVTSPFVLGIFRPRIYLPFALDDADIAHVIAHEQAHIDRRDHWWKPLGFCLLAINWFHPLMWAAYILLCRDIEFACDEKVIRKLAHDARADYSQALLSCSAGRRSVAACPLAFGEVGVKERVKTVLNYKKPAILVICAALVVCVILAVCFLTDPLSGTSGIVPGGLPQYISLEELPEDYSLKQAKLDGCVVMENSRVTSGKDIWNSFYDAVQQGEAATVRYVSYYTLGDPSRYGEEYYESIKDDYPMMFVQDLTFNGEYYTARWYEDGQEIVANYRYLMHYVGEPSSSSATYSSYDRYVLVNDNTVTWEDIEYGMYSADFRDQIGHLSVYTDFID